MIRRVVAFTGTARPRPTPATAVLIPTTRDCASASGPPELPGFSAASVWITSSTSRAAAPLRDGNHDLADDQVVRRAELGRRRRGPAGPHDGEIGQRVGADHGERGARAVG